MTTRQREPGRETCEARQPQRPKKGQIKIGRLGVQRPKPPGAPQSAKREGARKGETPPRADEHTGQPQSLSWLPQGQRACLEAAPHGAQRTQNAHTKLAPTHIDSVGVDIHAA